MNSYQGHHRWPARTGRDTRRADTGDMNWAYSNDAMMAALSAAPCDMIDETALPPATTAKRALRGDTGTPYRPPTRLDGLRVIGVSLAMTALAIVSASSKLNSPLTCVVAAGAVSLMACAIRALRRAPWYGYTRRERMHLSAALAAWPHDRSELLVNTGQEAAWDHRLGARVPRRAGAAALVWNEPNLVAVAVIVIDSILRTDVWTTHLLDLHHARIDLDSELRRINLLAHRLWRSTTAPDRYPAAAPTQSWNDLVDRADELTRYADTLIAIDALTRQRTALENADLAQEAHGQPGSTRSRMCADLNQQIRDALEQLPHQPAHLRSRS
ncbi:hypothetical protein B5P44_00090 [Mycobacterium sp. CBMA 213]|uniref:Uncharacterized protein n=1 Tax=Mycolicibacterium sp. CBMA 213 TaxID=1968788 RepID=A0A343VQZ0_9MYCO|nr:MULTISPECIES: hypothetical protein [unclassified Mycolicibacterium]AVN58314.1 hypothetical protein B5P44_p00019 [Mycolicibacterium sp. CBMA 213]MUL60984.1 hypothetical protein [Mycolicibacterium sp. CBMA 335]MUM03221.1 hypothetical protein [Mycolicibacterium sp. CBMA 213]